MKRHKRSLAGIAGITAALAAMAAPLAAGGADLPLRAVRPDIVLPGRANRFDYASIDTQRGLLFLAHLGSGMVTVVEQRSEKVIANITDVPAVHGVLAVPELAEAGHRVLVAVQTLGEIAAIDPRTDSIVGRYPLPKSCDDDHSCSSIRTRRSHSSPATAMPNCCSSTSRA